MIYLTSDIHGEYDLFIELLEKINFNSDEDKLYIIGDVVDRGKNPIKLLQYVYKNQDSMILLKGNHEDMMINALINNDFTLWYYNGGRVTHNEFIELPIKERGDLFYYLKDLPCIQQIELNDKIYMLVHAGLEVNKDGKILECQDQDYLLWARKEFLTDSKIVNDVIVIVGHTPTVNLHNSDSIWYSECGKKICIDCGGVFGYKLACLRLDDMKEFYVGKGD